MPKMVFPAACPACAEGRRFIEFKVEGCSPDSGVEKQYGFRCMACKTTVPEIVDAAGLRHTWVQGIHTEN